MSKSNIKNINYLNQKKKPYIKYNFNQKASLLHKIKKSTNWWIYTKKTFYKLNIFNNQNHLILQIFDLKKKNNYKHFTWAPTSYHSLNKEIFFFKKIKS